MYHVKMFPVAIFSVIVFSKQLVIAVKEIHSEAKNLHERNHKNALKCLKPVYLTSGFARQKGRKYFIHMKRDVNVHPENFIHFIAELSTKFRTGSKMYKICSACMMSIGCSKIIVSRLCSYCGGSAGSIISVFTQLHSVRLQFRV